MANTVSILSFGNTFGDLVTTQNALARENNTLAANNYTKSTGTLFLNDPILGLQIANNAIVQGGLQVQGIGSYGYIQNNLRVDQQVYFTNTAIGLTNYGQANVYGLLFANAAANSIIATNNITVGGNTFVTGSIYGANNLTIGGKTTIGDTTTIYGIANVANTLFVSQGAYIKGTTTSDIFVANTRTSTPTAYVTGLLDAGLASSQLNYVTANTLISSVNYLNNVQSNTLINAAFTNTTTLYAQTLSTPRGTVTGVLDANSASAFLNNLQVNGQFNVQGNFVVNGATVYNSNTFTLNAGSVTALNSSLNVNRGTSGANAEIRWNELSTYWDVKDVSSGTYYKMLTTQDINNTLTSSSTTQPASASAANTLNTLLNNANNFLQIAVTSAGSYGNSAFERANSAYGAANNVAPQIAPAFNQANAAYTRANSSISTINGTTGTINPINGIVSLLSNNGIVIASAANTLYYNTPQNLRTTDSPTFESLTLNTPLAVTAGGTGAQSSSVALQNLLPSTVGVPSGYVLGTTGGLGASFNWTAGGSGGGGGGSTVGTLIQTNRLVYTSATNQTVFTTPTYVTGSGQLRVYVNGVRQYTADYTETSTTSVTMNNALNNGDTVLIEVDGYNQYDPAANNIPFTGPFGGIINSANTVQLAIQDLETRKATLASPTFTGFPTAPTAPTTTSNTVIATTAWVSNWANASYTFASSITGNAGTVTNGVYTNGSYSDPSWLTLTKTKVGLSNVDNTTDANKSVNYANTAGSAGSATTATNLSNSKWTTAVSGTKLIVYYDGTAMFSVDTSGNVIAKGNITAYGSP